MINACLIDEHYKLLKLTVIMLIMLLQERVERKVDESHYVTENRIQKLDEAILEERAKIADIEHVSPVYLYCKSLYLSK